MVYSSISKDLRSRGVGLGHGQRFCARVRPVAGKSPPGVSLATWPVNRSGLIFHVDARAEASDAALAYTLLFEKTYGLADCDARVTCRAVTTVSRLAGIRI